MNAPFQAGDKVVCVDASPPRSIDNGDRLQRDAIYSVAACWSNTGGTSWAVLPIGHSPPRHPLTGNLIGWASERFRRIWTQTTSVTTSIEQPATR